MFPREPRRELPLQAATPLGRWQSETSPFHRAASTTPLPRGAHGGSDGKESACSAGDLGSTPVLGRSPGEGNGNTLQYSCLENPMERGAWWATVHGVTKSWTQLSDFTPQREQRGILVKILSPPSRAGREGRGASPQALGRGQLVHRYPIGALAQSCVSPGNWGWAPLQARTEGQTELKPRSARLWEACE